MPIELAEDNDDTMIAAAFAMRTSPNSVIGKQIASMLDDRTCMQRIAEHHGSLLVRMLAERALSVQDRADRLCGERNLAVSAVCGLTYEKDGRWLSSRKGDTDVTDVMDDKLIRLLSPMAAQLTTEKK